MSTPSKHSSLAPVWWVVAVFLLIEILVRFAVPFDLQRVLVVETVALFAAAAFLYGVVRRKPESSNRRHRLFLVLSIAFMLGGIRSGLWVSGLDVSWANLVILALALAAYATWGWRQRKQ